MISPVKIFLCVLIVLFLFPQSQSFAASLSELELGLEQKIVAYIDQREKSARALLQKVVNINSGTMNFVGVKAVADVFSKEFESLGFAVQWLDGAEFNRAGHLVASYGDKGPKLLLIGHLDTVFSNDDAFKRYERLVQSHARGPGIIDMKGGNIVMLFALKALKAAGLLELLSVRVVLTGDEEKRGRPLELATKALVEAGKWADVAIGFEDGDGDPKTAVISRRGASAWQLQVTAKAAHSSQIFQPQVGDGAIYEVARILTQFREELRSEENLTFNPGVIVGGTTAEIDDTLVSGRAFGKNNVIAKTALVYGDIRALSPQQLARAQRKMERIVKQSLNQTMAQINFETGYPPMAPSEGNRKLLSIYSKASQQLGYGEVTAVNPRNAGAADISFVAAHVEMAIDGIGLMGKGGHTNDETADMATLIPQTKRAALLMVSVLKHFTVK